MKNIVTVVMLVFLMVGCASSGNRSLQKETELSMQSKIKEGVTTKDDVKMLLGSPDSVSFTDGGNEIWKYVHAKVKVSGKTFIPFYGLFHNGTHGTKKELTLLFKGDVVEKYNMSETAINNQSGWSD